MIKILGMLFALAAGTLAHANEASFERCMRDVDVPSQIHLRGVHVIVFVESQCFGVYENGKLSRRAVGRELYGYASTGKRGHETPLATQEKGSWTIFHADRTKVSSIYNLPMPCALFFNGDIALHAGSDLRPFRSHGCVRLPKKAACAIFDYFSHSEIRVIVVRDKEDLQDWKG